MLQYHVFKPIVDEALDLKRALSLDEDSMRAYCSEVTYELDESGTTGLKSVRVSDREARAACEVVFGRQNAPEYGGRPMSKGDVVFIEGIGAFLCWSFGWADLGGYELGRFWARPEPSLCVPPSVAGREAYARMRALLEARRAGPLTAP